MVLKWYFQSKVSPEVRNSTSPPQPKFIVERIKGEKLSLSASSEVCLTPTEPGTRRSIRRSVPKPKSNGHWEDVESAIDEREGYRYGPTLSHFFI